MDDLQMYLHARREITADELETHIEQLLADLRQKSAARIEEARHRYPRFAGNMEEFENTMLTMAERQMKQMVANFRAGNTHR